MCRCYIKLYGCLSQLKERWKKTKILSLFFYQKKNIEIDPTYSNDRCIKCMHSEHNKQKLVAYVNYQVVRMNRNQLLSLSLPIVFWICSIFKILFCFVCYGTPISIVVRTLFLLLSSLVNRFSRVYCIDPYSYCSFQWSPNRSIDRSIGGLKSVFNRKI